MTPTKEMETIDVTGLVPEAIRAVESLVRMLREKAPVSVASSPSMFNLLGKAPTLRTAQDIA